MRHLFFSLSVLTLVACSPESDTTGGEALDPAVLRLADNRSSIQDGAAHQAEALAVLLKEAESAMVAGPFSVTDNEYLPPSGDKHDYISFGSYWWPDPEKPDGLPFIRKDGQRYRGHGTNSDRSALRGVCDAVETLALSWFFTGESRFADRAALLLRAFFLDPDTRMNPHLEYGQAIPGRVEGRGIGIIDTASLGRLVDDIGLVMESGSLSPQDSAGLVRWFDDYRVWLQTSSHGRDEDAWHNNHGTWYDMQVASFALLAGRPDTARAVLERVAVRRMVPQIRPDGRQPFELDRTRAMNYSTMNLSGMMYLADLGERVGVDLWNYGPGGEPLIRSALDYLVEISQPGLDLPYQQITPFKQSDLFSVLRRGARQYGRDGYASILEAIEPEVAGSRRWLTD